MILLLALLSLPDPSGVGLFLADLEPGIPVPEAAFMAPSQYRGPAAPGLFFRAGFTAGNTGSFHCRGNGTTGERTFFTAGLFSRQLWGYTLESPGLPSLGVWVDSLRESAFLEAVEGRLGLGVMGDSSGLHPGVLWESTGITAAAGPRGSGVGFSVRLLPGLYMGPALAGGRPWLKSAFSFRGVNLRSGPALNRDGTVTGKAVALIRGGPGLLAVVHSADSTRFGGTFRLDSLLEFGVVWPGPGCVAGLRIGPLSLSGSAAKGGDWSCGTIFDLPWGAFSAWVRRGGGWTLGLELGMGAAEGTGLLPGR